MILPEEESAAGPATELCSLAEAVCNGTITAAQYARLNSLLSADEDMARFYATYLRMHGLLLWHWRDAEVSPASSPALPIIVETSSFPAVPSSLFASVFSPGGFVFSYSLAVLIVAIGLLIGWVCQVPLNQQIAVNEPHSPTKTSIPEQGPVFVGRITGMVDCRWTDPPPAPVGFERVVLGRKYALASGLMEITYDTGARVILQGPCTYEVESPNGGYLSLGRLTARVEKRGEGRGERETGKSPVSNPQSCVPLSPLPSPLSPLLRSHSHRHGHRPRHGVRRRGR